MNEAEKCVVRECLRQMELLMEEVREVRTWWTLLSESNRQEWKDFGASVCAYRKSLTEREGVH